MHYNNGDRVINKHSLMKGTVVAGDDTATVLFYDGTSEEYVVPNDYLQSFSLPEPTVDTVHEDVKIIDGWAARHNLRVSALAAYELAIELGNARG
jgi:hypothetical protein